MIVISSTAGLPLATAEVVTRTEALLVLRAVRGRGALLKHVFQDGDRSVTVMIDGAPSRASISTKWCDGQRLWIVRPEPDSRRGPGQPVRGGIGVGVIA